MAGAAITSSRKRNKQTPKKKETAGKQFLKAHCTEGKKIVKRSLSELHPFLHEEKKKEIKKFVFPLPSPHERAAGAEMPAPILLGDELLPASTSPRRKRK